MALFTLAQVKAQEKSVIQISTDNTDLILQVAPNGRLYQAYLGDKLLPTIRVTALLASPTVFNSLAGRIIRFTPFAHDLSEAVGVSSEK